MSSMNWTNFVQSWSESIIILLIWSSTQLVQVYCIKHDITDVQCLMPGLLLAIRKVVRLKVANHIKSHTYYCLCIIQLHLVQVFLLSLYDPCRIWYMAWRSLYENDPPLQPHLPKTFNLVQLKGPSTPACSQPSHIFYIRLEFRSIDGLLCQNGVPILVCIAF